MEPIRELIQTGTAKRFDLHLSSISSFNGSFNDIPSPLIEDHVKISIANQDLKTKQHGLPQGAVTAVNTENLRVKKRETLKVTAWAKQKSPASRPVKHAI